jgi:hypothetical protein
MRCLKDMSAKVVFTATFVLYQYTIDIPIIGKTTAEKKFSYDEFNSIFPKAILSGFNPVNYLDKPCLESTLYLCAKKDKIDEPDLATSPESESLDITNSSAYEKLELVGVWTTIRKGLTYTIKSDTMHYYFIPHHNTKTVIRESISTYPYQLSWVLNTVKEPIAFMDLVELFKDAEIKNVDKAHQNATSLWTTIGIAYVKGKIGLIDDDFKTKVVPI